ncbi:MAG: hypothetical protein IIC97_03895, partial [Chloroflexi bacterium]|nr:hypothetical protein [Chloroflexota bacterium]
MIASSSWDQLDTLGFEVIRVVLSVLWQSSVLLGAAGLIVFALRQRSAAIRHRVWTAALLLTPLIPVLTWVGSQTGTPQFHIPIIPAFEAASVRQTQSPPSDEIPATHVLKTDASPATDSRQRSAEGKPESRQTAAATVPPISHTGSPAPTPRSAHLWGITLIAYTGGLALLLGLVSLGRFRLRRYTREGRIVTNPRLTDVFEAARKQLGIERGCVIVEIDTLHAPLTYQTFHPVIALPHGFTDELSDAELRTIALHELAHIKRHDPLVLNLASIIRAVFFFHPL